MRKTAPRPVTEIDLVELRAVINRLLDHVIKTRGVRTVALETPYYWEVPAPDRYNVEAEPAELEVGNLADDWAFVSSVLQGQHSAGRLPADRARAAPRLRGAGAGRRARPEWRLIQPLPRIWSRRRSNQSTESIAKSVGISARAGAYRVRIEHGDPPERRRRETLSRGSGAYPVIGEEHIENPSGLNRKPSHFGEHRLECRFLKKGPDDRITVLLRPHHENGLHGGMSGQVRKTARIRRRVSS